MTPLVRVEHLVTEFRTEERIVRAVDDVSFVIPRGKTVGIVGESGSGKSVTALSIMRLIPSPPGRIVGGSVIFRDRDGTERNLLELPEEQMRRYRGNRIGMIFQEPMTSLNPVFRCGDQVMEALQLHLGMSRQQARERTLQLFREVQLPRPEVLIDQYPHQLSGGQKQRVMIAMAMACNPDLLIADEPTTALDVTVQATILDLLKTLQRAHHMSVLFITHDLGVVAEIADYVVVMYRGHIVEQGTALDIFTDPKHPYTKGLLACRPRLDVRMRQLPTVHDFMEEQPDGTIVERAADSLRHIIAARAETPQERQDRKAKIEQSDVVLRVEDLKVHFPVRTGVFTRVSSWVKAVDGVSFEVRRGETLGLVGESGCGKTTTGRAILRLIEPTGGRVVFEGKDVGALPRSELKVLRRHMQIIFQDPYSSLNPRLTIGNAIMEVLKVHNRFSSDAERRDYIEELLIKVGLEPRHYTNYPHEFSGGQRQRVCIARALALEPTLLICDESVSALDVSIQAQVLNLLVRLREELGLTYIFISHDLSVVKFISDRIAVMQAGRIVELQDADELYRNPQQEYTRHLISAIPAPSIEAIRHRLQAA
ncbi:MAG: ABC transporter ATP-binding protein [Candidatus Kapaibacterium sp.]|nr:MAG: ABC transporter ATP-binding protein [Candidatus Kapabacteria bacterium]